MATQRILFVGVGGQGNLLCSRLLGEAAMAARIPVKVSEVHGMAQRGGVVESSVVMGDAISPIVSNNESDIIIGFEPVETLRALAKANSKTVVITSISKLPPFTVAIGAGDYPEVDGMLSLIEAKVGKLIAFDAMGLALKAENSLAVNMVMLGALFGAYDMPISIKRIKDAIAKFTKPAFLDSNLKAFDLGFEAGQD